MNDGFSGGEKKRLEMLQMAILSPRMAILDETDSGLDIDALRNVADGINATLSPEMGVLMITHYQRMLNYVKPQFVHVLLDGRVVMSGRRGAVSHKLEANGYDWVREQVGLPAGVGDEAASLPSPWRSTSKTRPMAVQPVAPSLIPGAFSGAALRADFAVFERRTRNGKRLVFLDAAASSPKPRVVIEAMADAYCHHYANVHRGIYELSEDATTRFEAARRKVAAFLGAPSEREIVFVRNATEAINLVAYCWGRTNVGKRRSDRDHPAGAPRQHRALAAADQARSAPSSTTWPSPTTACLDMDDLRAKLADRPKLLAVALVSNALGTINPIAEIVGHGPRGRRAGAGRRGAGCPAHADRHQGIWTATSWPSAATRCLARRASARSGAAASCWTPCRRS